MYARARRGVLLGKITHSFSGMTDCVERLESPEEKPYTVEMLKELKTHRDTLYVEKDWSITLYNCVYNVSFKVIQ